MANQKLTDDYPLSNEELVQKVKKEHESKQVRDYKFPTEIIDLPSNGLIYPKDNPLSSGKSRNEIYDCKRGRYPNNPIIYQRWNSFRQIVSIFNRR